MTSSILFVAFLVIATTSLSKCLSLTGTVNITQVQVVGQGLTCSNPSPLLFRPALIGATVSLSCNGGLTTINTTTTDSTGSFTIIVNNAITGRITFPTFCTVFVSVPANCTIIRLFQTVSTLRSLGIPTIQVVNGGQTLVVTVRTFIAA